MSEHTQEPWPYYIDVAQNMTANSDGPDAAVLSFEDYERARICVNRLAGISNEDIENPAIALLHDEPSSELVLLRMEVKEFRRKNLELEQRRMKLIDAFKQIISIPTTKYLQRKISESAISEDAP